MATIRKRGDVSARAFKDIYVISRCPPKGGYPSFTALAIIYSTWKATLDYAAPASLVLLKNNMRQAG